MKTKLLLSALILTLLTGCTQSVEGDYVKDETKDKLIAKYSHWTEADAVSAGYVKEDFCVDSSAIGTPGLGAMGYHAVNAALMQDNEIDVMAPEVLLINSDGKVVGLEWMTMDDQVDNVPALFDEEFILTTNHPGREYPHYVFHTYFGYQFGKNISWNPNLQCAEGSGIQYKSWKSIPPWERGNKVGHKK